MASAGKSLAILAEDFFLEGQLETDQKVVINGKILGKVSGKGEILLAASGSIEGQLEGDQVVIAGCVRGRLQAQTLLEATATADIRGDLQVPPGGLMIQSGAFLQGDCRTLSKIAQSRYPEQSPAETSITQELHEPDKSSFTQDPTAHSSGESQKTSEKS